jgi:hypothetical protein
MANTTAEERKQAQDIADMTETQKLLLKYENEKSSLIEKQTALQNILNATVKVGKD